jgi:hypothetical protein
VQSLVQDTHRRSKSNSDGKNSQAYPALARVPSELFGVCVVGTSGRIYGAGDVDYEFSIMSVSKPFLFALICETIGPEEARAKLGANATGLPFNSLAKIAANPLLPKEIQAQVDLDNLTCVSNDQLRSVMEKTTARPQQVQEALRVNTEARLRGLKIGLFLLFTSRFQHPADDRYSDEAGAHRDDGRRASPQRIIKAPRRIFIGSESHACAARLKNTPSLAIGSLDASVAERREAMTMRFLKERVGDEKT